MDDCVEYGAVNISLQECVQCLANIHCRRVGSNITLGQEVKSCSSQQQWLKRKIYEALFNRNKWKEYRRKGFAWQLLCNLRWDNVLVCSALQFRMKLKHKRYRDAEKLLELNQKVLQDGNTYHSSVLSLLYCLADARHTNFDESSISLELLEGIYQKQDVGLSEHYNEFTFTCHKTCNLSRNSLSYSYDEFPVRPYTVPDFAQSIVSGGDKHSYNGQVTSNLDDGSLYGGLVHSKVFSLDVRLSLPEIPMNNKLDLCRHLKLNAHNDDDEGFISRGSSPVADHSHKGGLVTSFADEGIFSDNEPYFGYRRPRYNLDAWKCINLKRNTHRTWETVGLCAGSSKQEWYLSESGSLLFDHVWKQRWKIVSELAATLQFRSQGIDASQTVWMELCEEDLTHHAQLVSIGIASESFVFNKLAHMFLPRKNIYMSGVTPVSLRNLLSSFAEWGTAYWRLFRFSAQATSGESSHRNNGVIFKALCEAVRSYLQNYQRGMLLHQLDSSTSLHQLYCKFQKAGSQISYLCRLCKCGSPCGTATVLNDAEFPCGVDILTYLYGEAVYCAESSDYFVLLYLLQKCCQPYLLFVQNWIFHGVCWDVTGEFLLRVNPDEENRRDRRRWNNYIQAEKGKDVHTCVPSFLTQVAEDLFLCGKTLELMQLIHPEHFLCTKMFKIPELLITFSKSRVQQLTREWAEFHHTILQLQQKEDTAWLAQEGNLDNLNRKKLLESAAAHDKEVEKSTSAREELMKKKRIEKREELERLKKQAEDDVERRRNLVLEEKALDAAWIAEVMRKEELLQKKEDAILEEAKRELTEHYRLLNEKADRRKLKAEWKIRRMKLQDKREKFLLGCQELPQDTLHNDGEVTKDHLHDSPPASTSQTPASDVMLGCPFVNSQRPGSNAPEHHQSNVTLPPDMCRETSTNIVNDKSISINDGNGQPVTVGDSSSEVVTVTVGDSSSEVVTVTVGDSSSEVVTMTVGDSSSEVVRTFRKAVYGQHVSDSSIFALLRDGVQDNGDKPITVEADSFQPAVRHDHHISNSTVQRLMYNYSMNTEDSLTASASDGTTQPAADDELHLPEHGIFDDDNASLKLQLACVGKGTQTPMPRQVDLLSALYNDVLDGKDDEDIMGLLAADDDIASIDFHSLPILLQKCVLRPIKTHAVFVSKCALTHLMRDLSLMKHFKAMRRFLLLHDGEFASSLSKDLFDLVNTSRRPSEVLNPVFLDSLICHSMQSAMQVDPSFDVDLSVEVKFLPAAFSPNDLHCLDCLSLRYHVGWPLNIVITESCHTKYNQVLSFLLRLKMVAWSLRDVRNKLKTIGGTGWKVTGMSRSELQKVELFRHEMRNFIGVMQGYVSTQVLHVCWREFMSTLENVSTIDELHTCHAEYINNCVMRCLLSKKARNVMNVINDVLNAILRFRTQLATPMTSSFRHLQRTHDEFSRLSNFLYKVVSRLVARGYQPHLDDFLLRLNFNAFYKD